jgi:hypothetical protein
MGDSANAFGTFPGGQLGTTVPMKRKEKPLPPLGMLSPAPSMFRLKKRFVAPWEKFVKMPEKSGNGEGDSGD